jgi:hypothetical protein
MFELPPGDLGAALVEHHEPRARGALIERADISPCHGVRLRRSVRAPAAIFVLVAVLLSAGCALRSQPAYVRVAEALSSAHLNEAIYVALPRLTPQQLQQGCRLNTRHIVRLDTPSTSLQMQIGDPFVLGGLPIVAVDDAGAIVTGMPLAIEAQDQAPPVLELRRDDPDRNRGALRTLNTGEFLLRVSTLCGVPGAATILNVKVVPVPAPVPPPPGQVTEAER